MREHCMKSTNTIWHVSLQWEKKEQKQAHTHSHGQRMNMNGEKSRVRKCKVFRNWYNFSYLHLVGCIFMMQILERSTTKLRWEPFNAHWCTQQQAEYQLPIRRLFFTFSFACRSLLSLSCLLTKFSSLSCQFRAERTRDWWRAREEKWEREKSLEIHWSAWSEFNLNGLSQKWCSIISSLNMPIIWKVSLLKHTHTP